MPNEESQTQEVVNTTKRIIWKVFKPIIIVVVAIVIGLILLTASLREVYKSDTADKYFEENKDEWEEFGKDSDE